VLGFEVEAINSVQFCCHTGYQSVTGQILDANDLLTLYDGLKKNGLHLDYSHVLTGYVSSLSFLKSLYDMIQELKSLNPDMVYVCDPVMGDNGKLYIPSDLVPFYRDTMINIADVLTPNQFEAELLTGITISNQETAIEALDALHSRGIQIVLLSSARLPADSSTITAIASKMNPDGSKERFKCEINEMGAHFTGTGDLTSALLLAWLHKSDKDLQTSLCKAMSSIKAVLNRTLSYASCAPGGLTPRNLELKLIQSKADLESPADLVPCVRL
jgi:pyridoxine kinase